MTRSGGSFTSYQPNQFYGSPGSGYGPGAPMVFQPTDTTQLGYSYGNVPTWRPNRAMEPPVPNPSMYHNRFCPRDPRCESCPGYGGCDMGSDMGYGGMGMGGSCQGCDMGHVQMMQSHRAAQMAMARGVRPVAQPTPPASAVEPKTVSVKPQSKSVQLTSSTVSVAPNANLPIAQPKSSGQTQQQRSSSQQRSTGYRSAKRNPSKKSSGGWLGLPSLSDIKL